MLQLLDTELAGAGQGGGAGQADLPPDGGARQLYCTVLYCTELYYTVLHCTVLYCTVLYCTHHIHEVQPDVAGYEGLEAAPALPAQGTLAHVPLGDLLNTETGYSDNHGLLL